LHQGWLHKRSESG